MIKKFKEFESVEPKEDFSEIINSIKTNFNEDYINQFIMEHFYDYCDDEEMIEAGYDDQAKYCRETGASGNGIEGDLITEMWDYLKDAFNINLSDNKYEDIKYALDYHIKDFFPYYYFVDYRKETNYQKMMKSLDNKL
jgi:hypothetical protein